MVIMICAVSQTSFIVFRITTAEVRLFIPFFKKKKNYNCDDTNLCILWSGCLTNASQFGFWLSLRTIF